jgi:hypothetical protein
MTVLIDPDSPSLRGEVRGSGFVVHGENENLGRYPLKSELCTLNGEPGREPGSRGIVLTLGQIFTSI